MKTTLGTGDVNSIVPIIGSINALEISITHPARISYSIDPNKEDGFYSPDINIQNNSKVPVNISIQSFKASSDSDIAFQDVMPDSMDWQKLSRSETKKFIALGLEYYDTNEWLSFNDNYSFYAAEIDNTYLGALPSESTGVLKLLCKHGLAFDGNFIAEHELIFLVSLV